ncbi:guanine nucleotide binding protein, alpha subunit [Flagelloscypha sp. PMI_526]|nr:guanine nucleotide binding protein, alpha subunit [Flagelloscypha sp. PMI_526]
MRHDRFTPLGAKVVICGTSNAGKSTVAKHLRICHGVPYSPTEREFFKGVIFSNSIDALITVIGSIRRMNLKLSAGSDVNAETICSFSAFRTMHICQLPRNISDAMLGFSKDPQVKRVISQLRRSDFNDSGLYFLRSIAQIASPDYIPSDEDILHCHTETRQISETRLSIGSIIYKLIDTPMCPGGSDTRENWQSSFEDVTVLILVFALSDYDRMRDDDTSVNRLVEAFMLFELICSSPLVKNSGIILFLNKMDLFREKLPHSRLDAHFPEYTGGTDVTQAAKYIL